MEQGVGSVNSLSESLSRLSGLELIQRMKDGLISPPPIAELLNFTLDSVSKGMVVFKGIPLKSCTNPMGSVHGGWYGTILDSAMACTIITVLPPGKQFTTLEFKVNLMKSIPLGKEVFAEGKIIHLGKTTAVAEAKIYDLSKRVYSLGTSSGLIIETNL